MPNDKFPKVVDFSTHWSGPFASRELVHLGADVIKVEGPRIGDGNRGLGGPIARSTDVHFTINSGTRSLAFDRRSPDWPRVVEAVTKWADAVIVGARPRDAKARGIDFQQLVGHNPSLVYCAVTGYGLLGPWQDYPAHGLNPDISAGVVQIEWDDGTPRPRDDYHSHGTILAGIYAALGILAALHKRDRGGGAQFVSISMWEAALCWMWRELQSQANFSKPWTAYKDLGPRYCMYRTQDDRAVLVCPTERKYWEVFVEVVGLPDEWKDAGSWERTGMDNGERYPEQQAVIAERMQTKPMEEWERLLGAANVPVSALRTVAEAMRTEHAKANGVLTTLEQDGVRVEVPLPPVSVVGIEDLSDVGEDAFDEALVAKHARRGGGLALPPDLAEHNREVLAEIGLPDLASQF